MIRTLICQVSIILSLPSDHSSEIFPHRIHTNPPLPSEIAPEPIPRPTTQYEVESDLIDLALDFDELSKDQKQQTQAFTTHRVLQTDTDDVTEFVYDDIPLKRNTNNELSTDAIELYRISEFYYLGTA